MSSTITLFEILTLAGAIIGIYVKLSGDVGKLKSRIIMLEKREDEVKLMLTNLTEAVQEIKILLAQQGIK